MATIEDRFSDRFGDYEIAELLGRGGMGGVWRARDVRRARTVAIKCLLPEYSDRPEFRSRFEREARVTASLSSPHVIPIHDWGEIDGRLFLDMRLVEGGNLADALRDASGGLPVARALDVLGQVAEALDAAHAAGLVHRDVKPSNVLLAAQTDRTFCYLSDFGIARIVDDTADEGLTAPGQLLGTYPYTAPELYLTGAATAASDVYSLACVFYETLCGRRAFDARTQTRAMQAHVLGPIPRAGEVRGELAVFDPVLAEALAKDPSARTASATELARAARRAWEDARSAAAPATSTGTNAPFVPRAVAAVVVALAAVVVAAVLAVLLTQGTAPSAAPAAPPPGVVADQLSTVRVLPVPLNTGNSVVVSPDGRRAYVSDIQARGVQVVDLATDRVVDFLRSGFGASEMALSPDGRTLAVANRGFDDGTSASVTLIDLAGRSGSTVPLPSRPGPVAFAPDGRSAYVGARGSEDAPGHVVTVLDVASRAAVRTVEICTKPEGMGLAPDGRALYVSCAGPPQSLTGAVSVLPLPGGPVRTIPTSRPEYGMTVTPEGLVYAAGLGSGTGGRGVDIVDPAAGTVRSGSDAAIRFPVHVASSPDGLYLAVAQHASEPVLNALSIVDTRSGATLTTANVSRSAGGVAVTPDGRRALVVSDTELSELDLPG